MSLMWHNSIGGVHNGEEAFESYNGAEESRSSDNYGLWVLFIRIRSCLGPSLVQNSCPPSRLESLIGKTSIEFLSAYQIFFLHVFNYFLVAPRRAKAGHHSQHPRSGVIHR